VWKPKGAGALARAFPVAIRVREDADFPSSRSPTDAFVVCQSRHASMRSSGSGEATASPPFALAVQFCDEIEKDWRARQDSNL
jgi:hypothetical protein